MVKALLERVLGQETREGWLVIELQGKTVRLAHVRREGERPAVEFAERRSWDPADPKTLERTAKEFGAGRFECITLLPRTEYQILLVDAPAVPAEEMRPALRWRVKDMLEYPVDEATIDVLELPVPEGAPRARQMYAVAARQQAVKATAERFIKAGMNLTVVDIADTAQRNLAALFEADGRGVAVLTVGEEGGLITVTFRGELYVSRHLDITVQQLADSGTGAQAGASGNLTLDVGDDVRAPLFERVLVEMQRTLDHCERLYPFFSIGRVVLGPLPEEAGLREHLAANLYLPVETMDPARVMRLPRSAAAWAPAERNRFLRLIGAGLRSEAKVH
jgi:MSHA biogenesis protein MshI